MPLGEYSTLGFSLADWEMALAAPAVGSFLAGLETDFRDDRARLGLPPNSFIFKRSGAIVQKLMPVLSW